MPGSALNLMKTTKSMMTPSLVEVEGAVMPTSTSPDSDFQWTQTTTEPRSQLLLPVVVGDMKEKENLNQKGVFKSPRLPAVSSSSTSSASSSAPNEKSTRLPPPTTATTTSSNEKTTAYHRGEAATSIVVCGVDGTVYTLDAYTGHLRGMFASGPAIFEPSTEETDGEGGGDNHAQESDEEEGGDVTARDVSSTHDSDNNAAITSNFLSSSSTSRERILPGLNGYLYKISDTITDEDDEMEQSSGQSIQELFPAKDVVDFPISACPENANTQQQQPAQEGCGIIIASKKTTIFAIDPTTGKVRWMQDPHGGAGGRGFTAHPPKSNNAGRRGRTVLLQREDYAVRHLDADIGRERWKLKLGQFSPLGFDVDDEANNSMNEDDDLLFSTKSSSSAAHGYLTFGQDGSSLMAADGISGEILWSRRIDSDIAAVYGIGKESKWVSLETFDVAAGDLSFGLDTATLNSQSVVGVSTSLSTRSEGISPFGSRNSMESHRIGQHGSHSYVISKFDVGRNQLQLASSDPDHGTLDNPGSLQLAQTGRGKGFDRKDDQLVSTKPILSSMSSLGRIGRFIPFGAGKVASRNQLHRLGGHDSLLFINPTNMVNPDFPHSMQLAHGHHAVDDLFPLKPLDMSMIDVRRPPPSHRTEHGLYLTWSMVAAVVMILLSLIVFVARIIILRQKKKWERIPNHNQSAAKSSEDGNSVGGFIPPQAHALNTPSLGSVNSWPKKYLPVTRSFSLGAIRTHSFSSRPMITERGRSDQNEDSSTILGASTPAISPNTARSKILSEESSSRDDSKPGVDNIDGIPLVRYSRYTSEFKEILALGRGGFGTVFRSRNVLDGREYAIKKIKISSPLSVGGNVTKHLSQKLHRVLREVKCLALLDHPNIVRYYTAWLEVDNGIHGGGGDDDESNTISSMFDRNSLVSGFESFSRAMQQSFLSKRGKYQRPVKGDSFNPLGWNNFGSFRLDESKSEASTSLGALLANTTKEVPIDDEEDDLGFTWERSNDNSVEPSLSSEKQHPERLEVDNRHSSSVMSVVDSVENENGGITSPTSPPSVKVQNEASISAQLPQAPTDTKCNGTTTVGRHILFIQMQLCSVKTLADFLANHEARGGIVSQSSSEDSRYAVDIPLAIRLFAQIAHGVKYVHKQGLIHRDLKPQNCFIDDAGIVKVGDFGLSRESSAAGGITDFDENDKNDSFSSLSVGDAENTVGVGTRAYASPEQMRGSNYDASTDVFSLGLILFELCYPMYTSMERYKEFSGIRKGCFPAYWVSRVQTSFPTLHELLVQMISETASERPSADAVSDQIDSLLREYSVQSLDKSWGEKGALLLRVEANETEGILAHSMKLIKAASPCSTVLQYGLRGQSSKAIMEFALELKDEERSTYVKNISQLLENHGMTVRVIN